VLEKPEKITVPRHKDGSVVFILTMHRLEGHSRIDIRLQVPLTSLVHESLHGIEVQLIAPLFQFPINMNLCSVPIVETSKIEDLRRAKTFLEIFDELLQIDLPRIGLAVSINDVGRVNENVGDTTSRLKRS